MKKSFPHIFFKKLKAYESKLFIANKTLLAMLPHRLSRAIY